MLKGGVVGLGQIGSGVAKRLYKAEMLSAVYDVREEAAGKLALLPNSPSPAAVARAADVVVIAVVNADQARDALGRKDGILSEARPGLTVVLCSTVSLSDLRSLSELCARSGVTLVDCGIIYDHTIIDSPEAMTCLIGAEDDVMARIRPIFEGFSRRIGHMGRPGAGMAAKIVRNMLVYSTYRIGFEASLVGRAAGVNLAKLEEIMVGRYASGFLRWSLDIKSKDEADAAAQRQQRTHLHDLILKDLGAALELAEHYRLDLPTTALTRNSSAEYLQLSPDGTAWSRSAKIG
jgi:3-hydroxyisobutyrate dehydrogenase